jgi:hypothetical protein
LALVILSFVDEVKQTGKCFVISFYHLPEPSFQHKMSTFIKKRSWGRE